MNTSSSGRGPSGTPKAMWSTGEAVTSMRSAAPMTMTRRAARFWRAVTSGRSSMTSMPSTVWYHSTERAT